MPGFFRGAGLQIYLFENLIRFVIALMNGAAPIFQEAAGPIGEYALNLCNDRNRNFIGCFCANIKPDRGVNPVSIIFSEF